MAQKLKLKDEIFREFLKSRQIILNGDITPNLIEKVVMQIFKFNEQDDQMEKKNKEYDRLKHPIKIYINSYGGSAYDCLSVIGAIDTSKTPVHTIALGYAMSAGLHILAAGHKRFCQSYSTLLYHQISSEFGGKLEDQLDDVGESMRLQEVLDDILIKRTKITKKRLTPIISKRKDWYINPKEALKYKIIDKII